MQRRLFFVLSALSVLALALGSTVATAQQPERIGVLMLHGKSPGSSSDPGMNQLKGVLERAGMAVVLPDMPWSRGRFMDGNWDKAMAEVGAQVKALRSQGATRIVVIGHSLGTAAALSYAARGGDAQALVLLAPGHRPRAFYTFSSNKAVHDSVDEARALIAAGKGDSRERFSDINQNRQYPVTATANDYLSYFDPAGDAEMGNTAPRVPASIPVLTVVGDADNFIKFAREELVAKLPANPKSQYLEVSANHLNTPVVATDAVMKWLPAALAP